MRLRVDLKIFIFLFIFYLTKQIKIYEYIMIFCIIHELGHILAGIFLKLKPEKIDIMPFGLSVQFKLFPDDYNNKVLKSNQLQIKKIIIAMAGPITNFVLIIALFNLLPIYPLDGGRILKGILNIMYGRKRTEKIMNKVSNILIVFITMICAFLVYLLKNIAIIVSLVYLWFLIINENKRYRTKEKIYKIVEENN